MNDCCLLKTSKVTQIQAYLFARINMRERARKKNTRKRI